MVGDEKLNYCDSKIGKGVVGRVEVKGNRRVFVETDIRFVLVESGFTSLNGFINVQSWDVWTHSAMNGIDAIVGATRSVLVIGESATRTVTCNGFGGVYVNTELAVGFATR